MFFNLEVYIAIVQMFKMMMFDMNSVNNKYSITQVLGTKNPTDATLVLSKMERVLSKIVELSLSLQEHSQSYLTKVLRHYAFKTIKKVTFF